MARRKSPRPETPPAADSQPVASPRQAKADPGRQPVILRAGHQHRDIIGDGRTPYLATPEEIELLRRYDAIVEVR